MSFFVDKEFKSPRSTPRKKSPLQEEQDPQEVKERIEKLVERSRAGDTEATADLLRMFRPLIKSYLNMAVYGRVNRTDHIMRGFLARYGKTPYDGCAVLRERLKHIPIEDLEGEVLACFLECVAKYSNIQYAFRRDCCRLFGRLAGDRDEKNIRFSEMDDEDLSFLESYEDRIPCMSVEDEEMWVIGVVGDNPLFQGLSEEDRGILVDFYLRGMDEEYLKDVYGETAPERLKSLTAEIRHRKMAGLVDSSECHSDSD